jgi:hypothetical protein
VQVAMAINKDDVSNASRKNAVVDQSIVNAYKGAVADRTKYPNFVTAYNSNPQFREYVEKALPGGGAVARL